MERRGDSLSIFPRCGALNNAQCEAAHSDRQFQPSRPPHRARGVADASGGIGAPVGAGERRSHDRLDFARAGVDRFNRRFHGLGFRTARRRRRVTGLISISTCPRRGLTATTASRSARRRTSAAGDVDGVDIQRRRSGHASVCEGRIGKSVGDHGHAGRSARRAALAVRQRHAWPAAGDGRRHGEPERQKRLWVSP